jgi:type II secretory pathway pseudopilin PulG
MFNKNKNQKGFMMVELIVISAVLMIIVIAASYVAKKSIEVSSRTLHTMQASFLLEEGAEVMRVLRDTNFDKVDPAIEGSSNQYLTLVSGTWSLVDAPQTNDIFTRIINIYPVYRDSTTADIVSSGGALDAGTSKITITVSWPEGTETLSKSLSFYLSDLF